MPIKFKLLYPPFYAPYKAHLTDAGWDIFATENITIMPHSTRRIGTGIALETPVGWEVQVRPRSGLSAKGIFAIFGTIDAGYRGEVCVTLYNSTPDRYDVAQKDRIAQLVPQQLAITELEETSELNESTARGDRGYGSTGK